MSFYQMAQAISPFLLLCCFYFFYRLNKLENILLYTREQQKQSEKERKELADRMDALEHEKGKD